MSARALGAAALWAQAGLQIAWYAWLAPPARVSPWLALGFALAPLLPCLLLWLRRPRAGLLWGGVVSLGYFVHGVMEAWAAPAVRALALAETTLALLLIGALGAATFAEKRAAR